MTFNHRCNVPKHQSKPKNCQRKTSTSTARDIEILQLIGQYFRDKGLTESYAQLSMESGIYLEHRDATALRHAVLNGRWNDAEAAVQGLASVIADPEHVDEIRFLILEQKFLEHLESDEIVQAVALLRNRITPMQRNLNRVHTLARLNFPFSCVRTLDHKNGELWSCHFSPDGLYLATGGRDNDVTIWRVNPARHTISEFRVFNTPAEIVCLCWSPDSKKLAACCGKKHSAVLVFDVLTGQLLCSQKVNEEDSYSAATFFADCRKLAFGGVEGAFHVMDTADQGRILASVEGYRVQCMAAIHSHSSIRVPDARKTLNPNPLATVLPGDTNSTALADCIMNDDARADDPVSTYHDRHTDKLLIADSLHRIRLFRFGFREPLPESGDAITDGNLRSSVYLTPTLNRSVISAPVTRRNEAEILLGVPILPVELSRGSSTHSRGPQTIQSLRQALQHSGAGALNAASHAVVSSTIGSSPPGSSGVGGVTGTGSNVTVLFGTPLERPTSANYSASVTALAEMRAITAAATAAAALTGPHPRSLVGLVHSLSSMVSASSVASAESIDVVGTETSRFVMTTASEPCVDLGATNTVSGSGSTVTGRMTSVTQGTGHIASLTSSTATPAPSLGTQPTRDGAITSYGLLDHRTLFREIHAVQSMIMSRCSKRVLITGRKIGLHLWDLVARTIVQRFMGCKQETCQLHSTFGGIHDDFVAAGDDNGRVHVWHTKNGNQPIYSITMSSSSGSSDAVTCVHWNPVLPTMMTSVNSAGDLCIWGPQRSHSSCAP
ncbi:WD repeat-containing protein 26 [Fasciola gigantica]|uniref:WD repeat-containing protein 26 n=1 Tax=Fasciola gigantica TaxID=46835 RepID=A0A504X0L4_FASGI|nr:WD repeat-containing protein 26 [Fasciola gigantica]